MSNSKLTRALLAATLPLAPQVQADDFDPELVSQLFLRTGFAGAAEQTTGLRYGLQYHYADQFEPISRSEPLMRMEFLAGELVGMNLGGVNVTPALDVLGATGLLGLGQAGTVFVAGSVAVGASIASSNSKDGGFGDLTEEPPEQGGSTTASSGQNGETGECGEIGQLPCTSQFLPTLSVLYDDNTLYYSRSLLPVDPAMVDAAD